MKQTIRYIKDSLSGLYEPSEIESFISLIFNSLFGYSRKDLILNSCQVFSTSDFQKVSAIVTKLKIHEPIQYILGVTEFYGLRFKVEPGVLIPRFETEELVDLIVKRRKNESIKILDIGTGSGCIAISLKKMLPDADIWGCDISEKALEIALENAILNDVEVKFMKFDVLDNENFDESGFDLIVSNPPYITLKEKTLMRENVLNNEPHIALFVPDDDPLLFYQAIVIKAKGLLQRQGELFFEINEAYGKEITSLLVENGFDALIVNDINGKDRFAIAKQLK
jgi:release factor glutamine methyltransferase